MEVIKMKRRVLSLLLIVMLLTTALPSTSFAVSDRKETITVGDTVSYSNKNDYTDFSYEWSITSGADCIRIESGASSKTVTITATKAGSAILHAKATRTGRLTRSYTYNYNITVNERPDYTIPDIQQNINSGTIYVASDSLDDVNNMFIGRVGGEPVIAYLDYTDMYDYTDGLPRDIDAHFVSFNDEDRPQFSIGIRISTKTKAGEYNINTKVLDYVCIHTYYNEENCRFYDYYRVVEGAKEWAVRFDVIDLNKGIIKGSVVGKLLPSKYNSYPYPTSDSVEISGSFAFQLRTQHPYMQEFRAGNPDYVEAHPGEFYQSFGGDTFSLDDYDYSSGTHSSTSSKVKVCTFCRGNRKCHVCHGFGYTVTGDSYNWSALGGVGTHKCSICNGSGLCTHCR